MSAIIKYLVSIFVVIIIIALIVVFVGGGNISIGDKGIKDGKKSQKQNQPEKTSEQYKMGYSFNGDKSQIIDLIKGNAWLNMVYLGKSKFTAKLFNSDGTLLTLLNDANGPYDQKQEIDVPETGSYVLDVKTSGEWSFSKE